MSLVQTQMLFFKQIRITVFVKHGASDLMPTAVVVGISLKAPGLWIGL